MKSILSIGIIFLSIGCTTMANKEDYPKFFQGRANEDCEFIGYIESDSDKSSPEASFEKSKAVLLDKANKQKANAVKVVNTNKVLNKISLSAESYQCPNLEKMKITDEARLNFNGF